MNLPDSYRGNEIAPPTAATLAFDAAHGVSGDRFSLGDVVSIFRRRLLTFLRILTICLLATVVFTQAMPPTYVAYSDVILQSAPTSVAPNKTPSDAADSLRKDDAVETEMELIDSRALARKTIDRLKLMQDPGFRAETLLPPSFAANLLRMLTLGVWKKTPPTLTEPQLLERAVTNLQTAITPTRLGSSYAIRISVSDADPERAVRIADAVAQIYVAESADKAAADNRIASGLVGGRLAELRAAASADTNAVQAYRIRNNLLSTAATSLTEGEISQFNQAVANAGADAAQDAARLAAARGQLRGGSGSVGAATESAVVTSLRSQRAAISTRVADLSQRYLDTYPELANTRSQLRDIDAQIAAEVGRTIAALEARAAASQDRLTSLRSSRGGARGTLATNNRALVGLTDLENKAKASQTLYEDYLARYNELVAKAGTEQPSARLVSTATQPVWPASPIWVLNLVLGLLVGILLGIVVAISVELSYSGLTTGEDVEARVGLRFLGSVPAYKSIKPSGSSAVDTVLSYPGGGYAESMRTLLTSMRQIGTTRDQVFAFTSALPGEGKTTVAASFAYALSLQHESVVLVDCDFVRGDLSRRYAPARTGAGFRELLDGTPISDGLVALDNGPKLIAITTPFAKGERLMEAGKLHRLIAKLREDYDFIILDCPPILPIAEVREIVTLADHVAIVTRWRKTIDKAVRTAAKLLPLGRLGDVGVILNSVDMRKKIRFGGNDVAGFYKKYASYYT